MLKAQAVGFDRAIEIGNQSMSDPYERVKGGRLAFKGGTLATRSKGIDKKRKKKNKKNKDKNPKEDETAIEQQQQQQQQQGEVEGSAPASAEPYTIDAAKRMKYEQLFPVEAKKFGYEPKTNFKSIEDALDDRVKKKADRYCK